LRKAVSTRTRTRTKGALELLERIRFKNTVVDDAAFCHRDLCEQLVQAVGDDVLAVKESPPAIHRKISQDFEAADATPN